MKKDKLTDAISSIDQDIVENFVLLDAKLQKKAATRRSRMIKILSSAACLVLVLSISISFIFDRKEPASSGEPPRTYMFYAEEELDLFLELITKDAEELTEYDILTVRKDDPAVMYDIELGLQPGEVFVLPVPQNSVPISIESMKDIQKTMESLGYFTAKDNSVMKDFVHTFYLDYPRIDIISTTAVYTENVNYVFKLWKNTTNSVTKYSFWHYDYYKQLTFGENKVKFFRERGADYFRIKGSMFVGENNEFIVDIWITTDSEQSKDKINLDQFVWRDYYED